MAWSTHYNIGGENTTFTPNPRFFVVICAGGLFIRYSVPYICKTLVAEAAVDNP